MGRSTLSMMLKTWISKTQENSKILQKWSVKSKHMLIDDY